MKNIQNLKDLLEEQTRTLYHAEKQKLQVFPKLREMASSQEVKEAVSAYIQETQKQVTRLEEIFSELSIIPGNTGGNYSMEYLLKQSKEQLNGITSAELRDIALIDCIQQINHYLLAGYGNIATHAEQIEYNNISRLLTETIKEEVITDRSLTSLEKEQFLNLNTDGKKERVFLKENLLTASFLSLNKKHEHDLAE